MTLRYHFISWLRRGAIARLSQNAADLNRAKIAAEVELTAYGIAGGTTVEALQRDLYFYGPADVLGFDSRAVLAAEPRDGSGNFEPNFLSAVRFHAPDFPWRFSPCVPDNDQRLQPWIVLIALTRDEILEEIPKGSEGLPPAIKVKATALPNLSDSWRWAHAQVVHDGDALDLPTVLRDTPHEATSRILCGRRLEQNKQYRAFVVPAFATGVAAGLGEDPANGITATSPAWNDNPNDDITLPYYFQWQFATGPEGDFETLIRALRPLDWSAIDIPIGVRPMDCSHPGFDVKEEGLTLLLEGAIQAVGAPWSKWGHDAPSQLATSYHSQLADRINQPTADLVNGRSNTDDPIVAPPVYGRWHAARTKAYLRKADSADAQAPLSPIWIDQLNLDPRHRAAAGLGALVAEKTQEVFMAAAWRQIGEVERLNQSIRNAQLAREAAGALHRRYGVMDADRKVRFVAPVAKRVLTADRTQNLAVRTSSLPALGAALDPAFRKIARPRGAILRRQDPALRAAAGSLLTRLHSIQPTARLVAAGAAPAPSGVATWATVGSRLALRVDVAATNFVLPEAKLSPAAIGTNVKALAGTVIGQRYGTATEVTALGDTVAKELGNFLGGEAQIGPNSPIANYQAEYTKPITDALNPELSIPRRIASLIESRPPARAGADVLSPVLAAPQFPDAMYAELRDISQQLIMPGAQAVPNNRIAILESNRRFIESYMAGLNHAFATELRWREYPTDQRGTCFRQFWDTSKYIASSGTPAEREKYLDIARLHQWTRPLGQNRPIAPASPVLSSSTAPPGNPAMVLVKGDLFRRYPNTIVYAVEATSTGMPQLPDETHESIKPTFYATLPPDMYFFGFDYTAEQLKSGGAAGKGFFIVLEECVGETRFGADEPEPGAVTGSASGTLANWNELSWASLRTDPASGYLDSANPPRANTSPKWDSSANVAYILQQWPMRVVIHAKQLLP